MNKDKLNINFIDEYALKIFKTIKKEINKEK